MSDLWMKKNRFVFFVSSWLTLLQHD